MMQKGVSSIVLFSTLSEVSHFATVRYSLLEIDMLMQYASLNAAEF